MPYNGGPESYEHLKEQAADVQRRAATRAARRAVARDDRLWLPSRPQPAEVGERREGRPWWMFWRR